MIFRYTIFFRFKTKFSNFNVKNDSNVSNLKHEFDFESNCDNESIIFSQNDFDINIIVVTKTFSFTKRMLKI